MYLESEFISHLGFGHRYITIIMYKVDYKSKFLFLKFLYYSYGNDTSPTLLDNVDCTHSGYLVLLQCSYSTVILSICTNYHDVYVSCCK